MAFNYSWATRGSLTWSQPHDPPFVSIAARRGKGNGVNELSLFTGAGGGLLGTHLLGWKPIGYVEINDYCQRVIAQRIADGILPAAPIFTDVREFVQSGAAAEYRGFADVVTAGFPCQPFSVAGKRRGTDDERNMWPAAIDTIRAVRPRYVLLENVPGLVTSGYFGTILGDLAESGYDARWRILSAAELGAPHQRKRLWIVAHTHDFGHERQETRQSDSYEERHDSPPQQGRIAVVHAPVTSRKNVAHADQDERQLYEPGCERQVRIGDDAGGGGQVGDTTGQGLSHRKHSTMEGGAQGISQQQSQRPDWWKTEPELGRLVDRMAHRVDRLKAIGNGQVPAVVRAAWHLLTEGIET